MINQLKKLAPETIEMFLETGDAQSLGIHEKLASYILQLDAATKLHNRMCEASAGEIPLPVYTYL